MTTLRTIIRFSQTVWHKSCSLRRASVVTMVVVVMGVAMLSVGSCERRPELYLRKIVPTQIAITNIGLKLETYWDYGFIYSVKYDWQAEWYYGWDERDSTLFGPIGYTEPHIFNIRRYYTASTPYAPHRNVYTHTIEGNEFTADFELGFWDILVWNDIITKDNVQSLNFDETSSLDSIIAFTNESMRPSRYTPPTRAGHTYYQPEELFSAYEQAIEINEDLTGFEFDPERNVWVKKLNMELYPVTYIYLVQLILHNNHNKVIDTEGYADISTLARWSNINTGKAGKGYSSVHYNTRFKKNCDMLGENVDIIGGRMLTFGIPNLRPSEIREPKDTALLNELRLRNPSNYLDISLQFYNGCDSTVFFDISDQMYKRFRGGVITVELDMDTVPVPTHTGGSAFDAIVKEYEEVTNEFSL